MTSDGNYPALGFNPAPGTSASVAALADDLRSVATEVGTAHDQISGIGKENGIWQGDAADAFRQQVGPLPDYLHKANQSLGDAGKVLAQWSDDLSSMQRTAAQFEAEAEKAKQQFEQAQANPDLKLANQEFPDQASLQQANAKLDAATHALHAANNELEAIRSQAKRLLHQHEELVNGVVKALNKAKDEAIPKPGLLERIGEAFSKLGKSIEDLASKAWDFIKRHANDIKAIGDVLSTVSAVLGAIAIVTAPFEPVGAVFAAAAAVTGAGALAAHGLAKAAGANVSWGSIGGDALGLIPFGGGFLKGGTKVATLAKDATPFAKTLAKGIGKEAAGPLNKAFGAGLKVAEKDSKQIWQGVEVGGKKIGAIGEDGTNIVLKGKGLANRMAAGANDAVNNLKQGQWLGTKGLDKFGVHIDPMSGLGRTLDAGIKGGKAVGSYVYGQIEQAGHPAPPPAAQTLQARLTARGAA